MDNDNDVYRLEIRCPVCGSVYPLDTTLGQLRELFRQDYPVGEIYPEKSMHEWLPLLGGICPGCWQRITGRLIYDGTQSCLVHPAKLERELRHNRLVDVWAEKAELRKKRIKRPGPGRGVHKVNKFVETAKRMIRRPPKTVTMVRGYEIFPQYRMDRY